ncbi:hypothetical protein SteCoe_21679 [Stentor coeruleus]|uniref:Uncharacterized protein n=1 Tax=Stentor coeruleus TaxID=5963 RepID=A0A1R2BNS7_9CILI|nr:hypothetical protein SteCoe_21679 [Stentor coeruleus]
MPYKWSFLPPRFRYSEIVRSDSNCVTYGNLSGRTYGCYLLNSILSKNPITFFSRTDYGCNYIYKITEAKDQSTFVRKKYNIKKSKPPLPTEEIKDIEKPLDENKIMEIESQAQSVRPALKIRHFSRIDYQDINITDSTPPSNSRLSTVNTESNENFAISKIKECGNNPSKKFQCNFCISPTNTPVEKSKNFGFFTPKTKYKTFLHPNDALKSPFSRGSPHSFNKDLQIISRICRECKKKHYCSLHFSDYTHKKLCHLLDIVTPASIQWHSEGRASIHWPELQSYCTLEDISDNELISKKEITIKSSSGSSTPHLYTEYKSRLQNLLLKHFENYDDEAEKLSDAIDSLSSDYEI